MAKKKKIDSLQIINEDLKTYVIEKITEAQVGGSVDLSKYALKANVPTKLSQLTNDVGYITSADIPEVVVPTKTSELTNDSGYITSDDIPSIPSKTSDLTNDSNFVDETYVTNAINNAQLGGGDGSEIDFDIYQTKTDNTLTTNDKTVTGAINEVKASVDNIEMPSKTSDLTNDSGFITAIPDEYITETELDEKGYVTESQIPTVPTNISAFTNDVGYLTEHQSLDNYVTKDTGNASQITFSDGETFQDKLDAGTLKGDKGDQGPQGEAGPQGTAGKDAATPNFTFVVNMIASDQTASVTTVGTYPDLTITFNIPQGTNNSTEEPSDTTEYMYYGRITLAEAGGSVIQYSAITADMITTAANVTKVESSTLDKTSMGLEADTAMGDYIIVAVPTSKGYTVTKDNGIGGKVKFNTEDSGSNGEVELSINEINYSIYGEILLSPAEIFIYID